MKELGVTLRFRNGYGPCTPRACIPSLECTLLFVGVEGLGFRARSLGCRILDFMVRGQGLRVLRCRVRSLGCAYLCWNAPCGSWGLKVLGLELRVEGAGFWVRG